MRMSWTRTKHGLTPTQLLQQLEGPSISLGAYKTEINLREGKDAVLPISNPLDMGLGMLIQDRVSHYVTVIAIVEILCICLSRTLSILLIGFLSQLLMPGAFSFLNHPLSRCIAFLLFCLIHGEILPKTETYYNLIFLLLYSSNF